MNYPPYADSDGFAIDNCNPPLDVGDIFEWQETSWEVAGVTSTACCDKEVRLIRRLGTRLDTWHGVLCVGCDKTYTFSLVVKL